MHLSFALLSNKRFLHSVRNRAVVEALERFFNHSNFVSNTYEQIASLSTVYCYLPDNFIKALTKEFFSYRADSRIARLHSQDAFV